MRHIISSTIFLLIIIQLNQGISEAIKTLKEKAIHLDDSTPTSNITWHQGSYRFIQVFDGLRVVYCEIKQPDGRVSVIINDKCSKVVDKVNYIHEGLWEVLYSPLGERNFKFEAFNVRVIDPPGKFSIKTTVNATDNQTVHLLCSASRTHSDFCLFTKPDGTVLNLPEKTANNKYEYYGKGYGYYTSSKAYTDCGLTIHEPSDDDFGMWQCSFGRDYYTLTKSVTFIDPKKSSMEGAYKPSRIYVKTYDKLTITCPRYAPLKYCSIFCLANKILHTPYTSLLGNEEGLKNGICETTIKNVNYAYSGNWSCVMGVVGGTEVTFPNVSIVVVSVSYLYALKEYKDNKTTFICNILPEKYATINYCQWTGPKGQKLHIEDSENYSTSYGQKSCSLTFNRFNETNLGTWFCNVNLLDDSDEIHPNERQRAHIEYST